MKKKNNDDGQFDLFDIYKPDNREIKLEKIQEAIKKQLDQGNIAEAKELIKQEKEILNLMLDK